MRTAVVSDIHGNLTALKAVLADLRDASPDLIFHGGDLAHGGSSPAEVVDTIRGLGWQGVMGNVDELLARPAGFDDFASRTPQLEKIWIATRDLAAAARDALGEERIAWLGALPAEQIHGSISLVHASPRDCWRSPRREASDEELSAVYRHPMNVYGHIHQPYVRSIGPITVVNTGSVSLSYDGDPRASYLLLDGADAQIRRVEYDVAREIKAMTDRKLPHSEWVSRMLASASPQMP